MGDPQEFASGYAEQGPIEILYIDAVASLYGRNKLSEMVKHPAENVFVPMTVGGGVRSVEDVAELLRCGADKVAINTAAVKRPKLISEVAQKFGSQCMVLSVEAKRSGDDWEAYTDNGREHTGRKVLEWVEEAVELGAGEILLTSVDREGTRKGFDVELTRRVASSVGVPVIASGGCGGVSHVREVVSQGRADAVAVADALHYGRHCVAELYEAVTYAH